MNEKPQVGASSSDVGLGFSEEIILEKNKVSTWMGKPIDDLSREELIEVVNYCGNEIQRLTKDRNRWMKAGDSIKYLMDDA